MKKLLTTMAVLTVVATPALAQGYTRSHRADAANGYNAYASAGRYGSFGHFQAPRSGTPGPIARNEQARLDHAKGEVGE